MGENQINLFTVQDIWDENDKQIPIDPRKKYDPLHFWEDFGDNYFKQHKRPQDIQRNLAWILHKLRMLEVKKVLDVGCGFCRLEPFLIDGKACEEITGLDISPKQLASSEEYLKEYPQKDKIKTQIGSIKNIPFDESSFDCILSTECMQHIHLPSVRLAMANIRKVTRKYVIIVERFVYSGEHAQPHLWSHDYTKMASDFGFKVIESKLIANGIIGVILEK